MNIRRSCCNSSSAGVDDTPPILRAIANRPTHLVKTLAPARPARKTSVSVPEGLVLRKARTQELNSSRFTWTVPKCQISSAY